MADADDERIHRLELALSYVLRGGVVISTLITFAGVLLMYWHHPSYFSNDVSAQSVAREMAFPHTVSAVFEGLTRGEGRAVIVVGLLVLIATPVLRVGASVVLFMLQRDRVFTAITLVVLVLLLASFALGRAGG